MGLTAKIGNERFRFGGNHEPQLMWPLVIRHLGNSWPPNPVHDPQIKHNASRCAVTAITARKQKERYKTGGPRSLWALRTPEAAERGVKVRIWRDASEAARLSEFDVEAQLGGRVQGLEIRFNAPSGELMHLKGYCVDHRLLRAGSANFSRSRETRLANNVLLTTRWSALRQSRT